MFILALIPFIFGRCSGGGVLPFELDPAAPLVGSNSAIDALSDEEYLEYARESLSMVAEGSPWGERLLRFLDQQSVFINERELRSKSESPGEGQFWISVYRPEPGEHMYFFKTDIDALMLPRVPFGRAFLGIILGHELRHAYDDVMTPELKELGATNHVFNELNAYKLGIELANNYTEGALERELQRCLEGKEYKKKADLILVPKQSVVERLDILFGPASPWEVGYRWPIWILGLSYANCQNQVERVWTTWAFHFLAGQLLDPPGFDRVDWMEHIGLDVSCEADEEIGSPIQGKIFALVEDTMTHSGWGGVIIEGTGPDENRAVRILGVKANVEIGIELHQGDIFGTAMDPGPIFSGLLPHLHVEAYENGKRLNRFWVINERWTDRYEVNPFRGFNFYANHKGVMNISRGGDFEYKRNHARALECYKEALKYLWWDMANTQIYHYIARCHASMHNYDEAARVQRKMVDLLEKELEYSKGNMPHPDLGIIGGCCYYQILEVQLDHHRRNLNAYEQGMDTIYVY